MRICLVFLLLVTAGIVQTQAVDPAPAAPAAPPPPVAAPYLKYELGPGGLIADWLVLGYLPGIQAAEKDRLGAIGGESKVSPYGGETVVLKGEGDKGADLTLTWRKAEARKPEIPYYMIASKGLYLFTDDRGRPITESTAYAYCELACTEDRSVTLRMSGGEPIQIWLNGEGVPVADRPGHLSGDAAWRDLRLKKGINRLLVRITNRWECEFLSLRLTDEKGAPPKDLVAQLKQIKDCPEMSCLYQTQDWKAIVEKIPPVPPSADEAFLGARLGRTMTLLETGGNSKRPVRILFYGQSITASEWVWLLVRELRARYPQTTIEAENWAIGGWGIDKLNRTIKHDILRKRPDLVVLHAYQGGSWEWERILQNIRRETTAEIMLRSAHIGKYEEDGHPLPVESSESLLLRRLARTYGCELVECRKEWLQFLRLHNKAPQDLRSDGIHLNHEGGVLMAQLYERHFRPHPAAQPWFDMVRRYEAMRPLADRRDDEVQLLGGGWSDRQVNSVVSTTTNDSLRLRFTGNRVDAIMPPHSGAARVLIDGRPPSAWNLFSGPRPWRYGAMRVDLMTYYMGTNMLAESWDLKFTHATGNGHKFRFTLTGSKTGPDGEGDNSTVFVSRSGRITINPEDFLLDYGNTNKAEMAALTLDAGLRWNVGPLYNDEVRGVPLRPREPGGNRYQVPYRYVTIADGLPPGEHELTLIPVHLNTQDQFSIEAIEAHCPPLLRDRMRGSE